jgi:hypothetical protein
MSGLFGVLSLQFPEAAAAVSLLSHTMQKSSTIPDIILQHIIFYVLFNLHSLDAEILSKQILALVFF